jgi:hypothetical protein
MLNTNNKFIYPKKIFFRFILSFILNNKLFLKTKTVLNYPFSKLKLKSDIKNIVYLNWLVPTEKIKHLVPENYKLVQYGDAVLLTVLNYKHGILRPGAFDNVKGIFGSPFQSNWRLYLEAKEPTVLFISNVMSSLIYSLGSRIFSNIIQAHYPIKFEHDETKSIIQSGESNANSILIETNPMNKWIIPEAFKSISTNHIELLNNICIQDFSLSKLETNKYCLAEINLGFDVNKITPLGVKSFDSEALKNITKDCECFAFVTPKVDFTSLNEKIIKQ